MITQDLLVYKVIKDPITLKDLNKEMAIRRFRIVGIDEHHTPRAFLFMDDNYPIHKWLTNKSDFGDDTKMIEIDTRIFVIPLKKKHPKKRKYLRQMSRLSSKISSSGWKKMFL